MAKVTLIDVLTLPDGTMLQSTRNGEPDDLQELSNAQLRAFHKLLGTRTEAHNKCHARCVELVNKDKRTLEEDTELKGLVTALGGDPGPGC